MKFLLENTILDLLTQEGVLIGIILAALGVAFSLLAKRITRVIRNKPEVQSTDPVLLGIKAFGLVCILVALMVIVFSLN